MKTALKISILLILFILLFIVYAFYIEPHRFLIHKKNIVLSKASTADISIVQISDTEIGTYYKEGNLRKHIDEINALSPDFIVFTGDLFNNYATYGPYEEMRDILSELKASIAKYAIYGNKDYGGGAVRIYEQLMNEAGFRVLKNEVVQHTIHQQPIQFVGTDSYLMGSLDVPSIHAQLQSNIPTIVFAHEPEIIEYLTFPFDLVLCGHTHGGQVAIPFLKTMFHGSYTPYQKGLYSLNQQNYVYVDSGMGTSRIPMRVFNPPQVSYLRISI